MKPFLSLIVGNGTSKIVGVLREMVFASLFGTSAIASAYRLSQVVFTAPTHGLVLETVSGGLVPLYKRSLGEGEDQRQALLVVASVLSIVIGVAIGAALFFLSMPIARFMARDADASMLRLSAHMIQLMGLAVPLYVAGNLLTFVETAHGHYGGISWRPTLLNVATLIAALIAFWTKQPVLLATGALASHAIFLIWTLRAAIRKRVIGRFRRQSWPIYQRTAWLFLRNSLPLMLLPLIGQSSLIVERMLAGRISIPVIAGIDYARFLTDTLLTMSSVPLGLITLSRHGGSRNAEAQRNLRSRTELLVMFAFPIGFFLSLNAVDVVRVVFARGAFNADSVGAVAPILFGMGWGLGATVASYFQLKALNAQIRNVAAVAITAAAAAANLGVDVLLWKPLGALALGLGVSAYGLTAFILSCFVLRLWRALAGALSFGLVALAAIAGAHFGLQSIASPLLRLMANGLVVLIACAMAAAALPATRPYVMMVRDRLWRKGKPA